LARFEQAISSTNREATCSTSSPLRASPAYSFYMLSGIASAWFLASDLAIRACCACPWPLPERRPATPQAARLGRSGGSGLRTTYCLGKFETTVSLLLTTRGRSVCSSW
jgi:hypothetical protein